MPTTLPRAARRLLMARFVVSLGQGALGVDFALYARALHWSPGFLGAVVGGGILLSGVLTAIGGPLSDRLGRKPFLLGFQLIALAAGIVTTLSARAWLVAAMAVLAGYGRGTVGAPAMFGAVEQAWLAGTVPNGRLGRTFARNAAMGFFGTAIGSFLGALPHLWRAWLPGPLAYRPLFALSALVAVVAFGLLAGVEDARPAATASEPSEPETASGENRLLLRLAGVNALNGIGVGLLGPMLSWWFAARYGAGPGAIGPAMGAALLLSGLAALIAGRAGGRFGAVRVVVAMRAAALALLVVLPFAPSFALAITIYAARSVLNRGTAGHRQALVLGAVRGHRRGLAASVSGFATQIPRALGPLAAGAMFGAGLFAAPFLLAALFQGVYIVAYQRLFAPHDLKDTGPV